MKSYTDIEQSKTLAKILPFESADMEYLAMKENGSSVGTVPFVKDDSEVEDSAYSHIYERIACWSLAALLSVIPYNVSFNKAVYCFKLVKLSDNWECYHENFGTVSTEIFKADNPVDACYDMIIKLNKSNVL